MPPATSSYLFGEVVLRHPLRSAALFASVLGGAGAKIVAPATVARFVDAALAGLPLEQLVATALVFVLAAVTAQVAALGERYFAAKLMWAAISRLRSRLLAHALDLESSYHDRTPVGEVVERLDADPRTMGELVSGFAVYVLSNLMLVVGVVIYASVAVDWRFGGVFVLVASTSMLTLFWLREFPTKAWLRVRQENAALTGHLDEFISGVEGIVVNNALEYQERKLEAANQRLRRNSLRASIRSNVSTVSRLIFVAGTAAVLIAADGLLRGELITVGVVFAVYYMLDMLMRPVEGVNRQLGAWQKGLASVRRVLEFLATPSRFTGRSRHLEKIRTLAFVDVAFGYLPRKRVLEHITIRIGPGRRTAIVGRTGSGKSSIVNLAARLSTPGAGRILINDHDLVSYSEGSLRNQLALVRQGAHLFEASVRDNVKMFDDTVTDDSVVRALGQLGLSGRIDGRRGLDEIVMPGRMSSGEAQLLAVARALVRRPSLVILDEATSRLDEQSERQVLAALRDTLPWASLLLVTHEPRLLEHVDQLVIIADGRVVETGSPAALRESPHLHAVMGAAKGG